MSMLGLVLLLLRFVKCFIVAAQARLHTGLEI